MSFMQNGPAFRILLHYFMPFIHWFIVFKVAILLYNLKNSTLRLSKRCLLVSLIYYEFYSTIKLSDLKLL